MMPLWASGRLDIHLTPDPERKCPLPARAPEPDPYPKPVTTPYDATLPFLDMTLSLDERMALIAKRQTVYLTPTLWLHKCASTLDRVIIGFDRFTIETEDFNDGPHGISSNEEVWDGLIADEFIMWLMDDTENGVCRIGEQWYVFSSLDGAFNDKKVTHYTKVQESDARMLYAFSKVEEDEE